MKEETDYENELTEEELEYMKDSFDKDIWSRMKSNLKEMTKREACFACFIAGYDLSRYSIEEELEKAKNELKEMSEEEVREMFERMSGGEIEEAIKEGNDNSIWEDRTKVNGVWIDDRTGKALEDGENN